MNQIKPWLERYKFLSTTQFYRLAGFPPFDPKHSGQRVLRDQLLKGYTARPRTWNRGEMFKGRSYGRPHTELVYWLGRERKSLNHEVEISNFHLDLDDANGEPIWWKQDGLTHEFPGGRVDPDALFYFNGYYYFLEMQLSGGDYNQTEQVDEKGKCIVCGQKVRPKQIHRDSGLMRKIHNFANYTAEHYKTKWEGMTSFILLIIVENKTKRDNLLRSIKEHYPYSFIRVASLEEVKSNPTGQIWHSHSQVYSLK